MIILALAVLVGGSIFTAWLFLKNTVSVELALGQSFRFKGFEVKVQELQSDTCIESLDFVCTKTVDDPSVLLKVTSAKQNTIDFLNLGEVYGLSSMTDDLQISQGLIDLESMTVMLVLKKI